MSVLTIEKTDYPFEFFFHEEYPVNELIDMIIEAYGNAYLEIDQECIPTLADVADQLYFYIPHVILKRIALGYGVDGLGYTVEEVQAYFDGELEEDLIEVVGEVIGRSEGVNYFEGYNFGSEIISDTEILLNMAGLTYIDTFYTTLNLEEKENKFPKEYEAINYPVCEVW